MKMEENETLYKQLRTKQTALAPLCRFEIPQSLCDEEKLFYRRQHLRLSDDMRALIEREGK